MDAADADAGQGLEEWKGSSGALGCNKEKYISIVNRDIFLITGYLARTINVSLKTMGFLYA